MKKIVIASACRTAIGKFGGTLANVPLLSWAPSSSRRL